MSKQFEIPDGYELLMSEPKLISELSKAERKKIGRKVLNATLENAPEGTMIYGDGSMILPDGSKVHKTGHGRGRNAQYDYEPPQGYEVIETPAVAGNKDTYMQSVNDVRQERKEGNKARYDAHRERMAEDGISADKIQVSGEESHATAPQSNSIDAAAETEEPRYEFTLPRAWEVVKVVNPGISSIANAIDSGSKIFDQAGEHGVMPTLRDAGRGLTAGAYDAADVVTSLGGLAENPVSRKADEIADAVRASNEIPDSEVERVGELASEALAGGSVGGVIGKGFGTATGAAKKLNTLKGAEYDRHIRKVAKDAGKIAREFKPMGKYPPRFNADMVEANAYNNLQKRDTPNLFSATPGYRDSSLLSKAIENMKYPFTGRGALERNNVELERLFNQGHTLKDAQKILHSRFVQYPTKYGKQGQNIGAAAGMLMGANGGSDNDIIPTPKPYRNRRDIQLEGGMPDYDSVLDMSDAEFNEYDRKYLGGTGVP